MGGGSSATGVVLSLEIFGFGVWMGFFFSNRRCALWTRSSTTWLVFGVIFSGFCVDEREDGREGFDEADGLETALGRCASCLVLGLWEWGFGKCGLEGWARGVWKRREFGGWGM